MTENINAETQETEIISFEDIENVKIVQNAVIEYDSVKKLKEQVKNQMAKVGSGDIIVDEDNYADNKKTRAEYKKIMTALDRTRIDFVKEVKKPLEEFEKTMIETKKLIEPYVDNLDNSIKSFEENQLMQRIGQFELYFGEKCEEHLINFIDFEQTGIKINLTTPSDAVIKNKIDQFLEKVVLDMKTIDMETDQDLKLRIKVKYKETLDLNNSMISAKRELAAIQEQKEIEERKAQERLIQQQREAALKREMEQQTPIIEDNPIEEVIDEPTLAPIEEDIVEVNLGQETIDKYVEEPIKEEIKEFTTSFEVTAPLETLKELKAYMTSKGIKVKAI